MIFYHIRHLIERIYKEQWLVIGILLLVMMLGIDWGLPNQKGMALLVGDIPPTKQQLNLLDSQRKEYLLNLEHKFGQAIKMDEQGQKDAISSKFWRTNPVIGNVLTEEDKIIAFRAFVIGSGGVDERKVFSSLSRMNPSKLDFDPKRYIYGGGYIYPLGGILYLLKSVGLFHATTNFEYYLKNPSQVAIMYITGRALNVMAFVGTLCLLALFGNILVGRVAGTLSMLTYSFSSLVLVHVLISKPHLYASFWAFLAVFLLFVYSKKRKYRFLICSAISSGWAAGSILPAIFMSVMYPILLFDRRNIKHSIGGVLLAWAIIGATFVITNPYAIIGFDRYFFELKKITSPEGYGHAVFSLNKIFVYLKDVFLKSYAFPVAIFGGIYVFVACFRERYMTKRIAVFFLCTFVPLGFVAFFPKTTLFLGPILCLFTGVALSRWVFSRSRIKIGIKVAILSILFFQGALVTILFVRDYICDEYWYEPTSEWVQSANIGRHTTIGVFSRPGPTRSPPFPFFQTKMINMNKALGNEFAPEYVITWDNNAQWEKHPMRDEYVLAYRMRNYSSYKLLKFLTGKSVTRVEGYVYKHMNLGG